MAELAASVAPTTVEPGGTLTVTGEGCFDPVAGAILLEDGTGLGVGESLAPEGDGTFVIALVVPPDVAAGTVLTVKVDCGFDGQTVQTVLLTVVVADADTPITDAPGTSTTAPAPAAVTASPRFTG